MAEAHVIRVMAVDDHPLMMAGISGEINAQADVNQLAARKHWIDCSTTRKRADHSLHLHDFQLWINQHLCELSAEGVSAMSHCSARD